MFIINSWSFWCFGLLRPWHHRGGNLVVAEHRRGGVAGAPTLHRVTAPSQVKRSCWMMLDGLLATDDMLLVVRYGFRTPRRRASETPPGRGGGGDSTRLVRTVTTFSRHEQFQKELRVRKGGGTELVLSFSPTRRRLHSVNQAPYISCQQGVLCLNEDANNQLFWEGGRSREEGGCTVSARKFRIPLVFAPQWWGKQKGRVKIAFLGLKEQ